MKMLKKIRKFVDSFRWVNWRVTNAASMRRRIERLADLMNDPERHFPLYNLELAALLFSMGESFDIALKTIYSNFRSLYLHKGIGYAGKADEPFLDEETGEPINIFAIPLLIKVDGTYISIELTKITDWFADVVKISLFQYFVSKK